MIHVEIKQFLPAHLAWPRANYLVPFDAHATANVAVWRRVNRFDDARHQLSYCRQLLVAVNASHLTPSTSEALVLLRYAVARDAARSCAC